ncbi:transcription initiation protein [Mycobacterium sp. E2699]|uniref:YciI family protein n=1 Tax=Mycobacterium sp. E2699 TaxID=1834137 RepID=UPI0007FC56F3|nr:YciI family protein [Mycobacterium sp. E2699]OBH04906.1 transcription initiation protein [Mycobacterium sp. E2699]
MQYFALLISRESDRDLTPDERAEVMTAFEEFHAKAGSAIRAGDALLPTAQPGSAVRISGGPDAPVTTDGPFAEAAEVACGYYVFEAENLDEALALARGVPVAQYGAVEVWPMFHSFEPSRKLTGDDWLALLLEPPASAHTPGTPEWEAMAGRHGEFMAAAGDHLLGGAALHDRSTATTVRVRDGEALITDGPYAEGAEVATGFYLLGATDRDEAVKVAAMIPASAVELRHLAGVSAL